MTEPRNIADRMRELRDLGKRQNGHPLHETVTLPLHEARFKARQLLDERAASYVKIVENLRQLPDGQIQFTIRRLEHLATVFLIDVDEG
jgi:hypothetical protein